MQFSDVDLAAVDLVATDISPVRLDQLFTGIPAYQSAALAAFAAAVNYDGWTPGPASELEGITVSDESVTGLELPDEGLTGSPGDTLSSLGEVLEVLDLSGNPGMGRPTLSAMSALTAIDLSDCNYDHIAIGLMLVELDAAGVTDATIDLGGIDELYVNSAPVPAGVEALLDLEEVNTSVTVSTVAKATIGTIDTVATGDIRLVLKDGSAELYMSAFDAHALINSKFTIEDDNGAEIIGYGHAGGNTEAFGSNVAPTSTCTDPDDDTNVTTGWTAKNSATLTSVAGGETGYCLSITENGANNPAAYKTYSYGDLDDGELYRIDVSIKAGTEDTCRIILLNSVYGHLILPTSFFTVTGSWTTYTYYFTAPDAGDTEFRLQSDSASGEGKTIYFDNTQVRKATALGETAIQIRSTPGGSTRNWVDVPSGFETWGIASVTIENECYMVTKDGEAKLLVGSLDLSDHTGAYALVRNTSGPVAGGWLDAGDDAEAFGGELIAGWTNMSGSAYETFTINANGHDINSAINSVDNGYCHTGNIGVSVGQLILIDVDFTLNSGVLPKLRMHKTGDGFGTILTGTPPAGASQYIYTILSGEDGVWLYNYTNFGNWSCSISIKIYTALGPTAATIESDPGEADGMLALLETAFSPNTSAISTVEIYHG
jgi:hypothetical protein